MPLKKKCGKKLCKLRVINGHTKERKMSVKHSRGRPRLKETKMSAKRSKGRPMIKKKQEKCKMGRRRILPHSKETEPASKKQKVGHTEDVPEGVSKEKMEDSERQKVSDAADSPEMPSKKKSPAPEKQKVIDTDDHSETHSRMSEFQSLDSLKCGFCHRGVEVDDVCGVLYTDVTKEGIPIAAHRRCLQYSTSLVQYKSEHFGGFKIAKVLEEIHRSRFLICHVCKNNKIKQTSIIQASATCALKTCGRSFHFYCAKTNPVTVTKRLVVLFNTKKKKTLLYRVFCCAAHETEYRANLKSLIESGKSQIGLCDNDSGDTCEEHGYVDSYVKLDANISSHSSLSDNEHIPLRNLSNNKKDTMVSFEKSASKTSKSYNVNTNAFPTVINDADVLKSDAISKSKNKLASRNLSPPKILHKSSPDGNTSRIDEDMNPVVRLSVLPDFQTSHIKTNINPVVCLSKLKPSSESPAISKKHHGSQSGLISQQSMSKVKNVLKEDLRKRRKETFDSDSSDECYVTGVSASENLSLRSSCLDDSSPVSKSKPLHGANAKKPFKERSKKKKTLFESDTDSSATISVSGQHYVVNGLGLNHSSSSIVSDEEDALEDYNESDETVSHDDDKMSDSDKQYDSVKGSSLFNAKKRCVLCVPAISKLSPQIRSGIAREICKADGSDVNIMMWHELHPTVSQNNKDLVFLIMDLAKCLEFTKVEEFKKLLLCSKYFQNKVETEFKINSKMLDDLEDPLMVNQILEKTWKKASQVLTNISEKTGSCVGSILSVESCSVLKIYIGDMLDRDGSVRSVWSKSSLTLWDDSTRLSLKTYSGIDAYVELEEKHLEKWLSTDVSPLIMVAIHPQDKIWKMTLQSSNLVEHLRTKSDKLHPAGTSVLVFERVDTQVVNFDNYFRKVLKSLDSARLSNLVILLSASLLKSDADRSAVVSLLPGDMQSDVKVFTAFDPASMPCSWVILQINISSTTKEREKSYKIVVDKQVPSVSKERRKRGRPPTGLKILKKCRK